MHTLHFSYLVQKDSRLFRIVRTRPPPPPPCRGSELQGGLGHWCPYATNGFFFYPGVPGVRGRKQCPYPGVGGVLGLRGRAYYGVAGVDRMLDTPVQYQ